MNDAVKKTLELRRKIMMEFGWTSDDMNDIRDGIIAPYVLAAAVLMVDQSVHAATTME